jgi:hypothetical protein
LAVVAREVTCHALNSKAVEERALGPSTPGRRDLSRISDCARLRPADPRSDYSLTAAYSARSIRPS